MSFKLPPKEKMTAKNILDFKSCNIGLIANAYGWMEPGNNASDTVFDNHRINKLVALFLQIIKLTN